MAAKKKTKSAAKKKADSRAKLKAARESDIGGRAAWGTLATSVEGHGSDAGGLILLCLGILSALGVYADLTGIFGHAIKFGTSALLGWGHLFVPIALIAVGLVVLSGRFPYGYAPRLFFGSILLVMSLTGLTDLIQGAPGVRAPVKDLQHAGGYVGALSRGPFSALLGQVGAFIVLSLLLFFAFMIVSRTTIDQLLAAARLVGEYVMDWLNQAGRAIGALGDQEKSKRTSDSLITGGNGDMTRGPVLADFEPEIDVTGNAPGYEEDQEDDFDNEPFRDGGGQFDVDLVSAETNRAQRAVADMHPASQHITVDAEPATPTQWKLPPLNMLSKTTAREMDHRLVEARGRTLEEALKSHGVVTNLIGATVGPTVTRYELELAAGVKVARVTALNKDIAYAMAAEDVRILAPIPGRSAIGVEVPNRERQLVSLGDVLSSPEAKTAKHPLEVAIGRDINGRALMLNLAETPHILIAGATGAGKSSCVNSMITSIMMRATPDQVRLILIDPKRVELGQYNGLPHLLTQVVVNPKRAANALQWAVKEMEMRYDLLAEVGVRDITGYNAAWDRGEFMEEAPDLEDEVEEEELEEDEDAEAEEEEGEEVEDEYEEEDDAEEEEGEDEELEDEYEDEEEDGEESEEEDEELEDEYEEGDEEEEEEEEEAPATQARQRPDGGAYERLPFIVVVVDELNDLMMVAARDVEESICRIAQMARAVGIHLVIATQRPSVDVITGVIKANVPSRLAFAVSTLADSRVILDQPGAERLVGKGDMLLATASSSVARRLQGPWVSEDEVRRVVAHWKRQSAARYVPGIEGDDNNGGMRGGMDGGDADDLLETAMELVVRSQLGSTSMLQRKLRVGFARAGRLIDLLEQQGVVGPSEGSKARQVLMTQDELDAVLDSRTGR